MNKIVLTTDSGMCPDKKYHSIVIPDQIVRNDGITYSDNGNEISSLDILQDKNHTYKTSAPLLEDYKKMFIPFLQENYDILHLSLGSGISSASVNNAHLIADELNDEYGKRIHVIDSCTGSVGGSCYYEAAYQKLIHSQLSLCELKAELEELKTRIITSFYVPDATGFIRSGRDSSSKYSFSKSVLSLSSRVLQMANMKYRVDFLENGDLFLKKMFRSSSRDGMLRMTREIVNSDNIYDYEKEFCVIGNLHSKNISLDQIGEYLDSLNYFNEILVQDVGTVVAPYGCDDLCGISLVKKKRVAEPIPFL